MKAVALMLGGFLLGAQAPAAQSAASAGLTGTWTGSMSRSASEEQSITLELTYDGKVVLGTITGPPYPGDIRAGTFDPASGALTLDVAVRDPGKTVARFEGTVADGTAHGTVTINGQHGTFRIRRNTGTINDFDYLLGDWEFTAESKEFGKFRGYWSAVRLDTGQILDEYRVVGDKGETYYVTTTLRNYNKSKDRWELIGASAGDGLQDFGTGRRTGAEMLIDQTFGVASGQPSTWKIRYYNIQPDRFSWTGDRSTDGGQTWTKEFQRIEAHRIGAARSLGPLAAPKKTSGE